VGVPRASLGEMTSERNVLLLRDLEEEAWRGGMRHRREDGVPFLVLQGGRGRERRHQGLEGLGKRRVGGKVRGEQD